MSLLKAFQDRLLTNVIIGLLADGCISESILPELQVSQNSGKLGKYGTSHLRIEHSATGGRGAYRRVEAMVRTSTGYQIASHGLEGLVTPDDYRNYDGTPFKPESEEAMGLQSMLLLEKEKALADSLADTAVMTQNTTLAGTSQLSDYVNSNALSTFKTARAAVRNGCGAVANVAIMDYNTADVLRYHPELLDSLGYKFTKPGGLADDDLKKALGVQQLLIANCMYESAKEGQTSSLAPVWGKHIIFGVCPAKPQIGQVALGYQVQLGEARKVFKAPVMNPPESTSIIVRDEYQQLLTNVGAAYLVKNAVA